MLLDLIIHLSHCPPVVFWVKQCPHCKTYKLVYMFYPSSWKSHTNGLRSQCKECQSASGKIFYQEHREDILTKQSKNPNQKVRNRKNVSAYNQTYYLEHKDNLLKTNTSYRKTHKAQIKAMNSQWNKKDHKLHPEKARNKKQKRRAQNNGTLIIETINLEVLAIRDNWICHICKKRVTRKNWSHDHLITVADKGETSYLNVALAHTSCNSSRGNGRLPGQLRLLP